MGHALLVKLYFFSMAIALPKQVPVQHGPRVLPTDKSLASEMHECRVYARQPKTQFRQ